MDRPEVVNGWLELMRVPGGVMLSAKVSPDLELFMKGLGNGEAYSVQDYTNGGLYRWAEVSKDAPPLKFWHASSDLLDQISSFQKFTLSSIGGGLEADHQLGYLPNINMSWLRCQGISEEHGIKFLVSNVVCSRAGLLDIRDRMVRGMKYIYSEYVKPVKLEGIIYESKTSEG